MKRLVLIVIGLMFLFLVGFNNIANRDKKTAEDYVKSKGYKITARMGQIYKYKLEESKLYILPYQQSWGVQKVEPDKYFGKEITIYAFTVKNHPMQKKDINAKNGVNVYIMMAESKVIGGYSYPNAKAYGALSSLDGKTLEEVTGLSYLKWSENWKKKYGK